MLRKIKQARLLDLPLRREQTDTSSFLSCILKKSASKRATHSYPRTFLDKHHTRAFFSPSFLSICHNLKQCPFLKRFVHLKFGDKFSGKMSRECAVMAIKNVQDDYRDANQEYLFYRQSVGRNGARAAHSDPSFMRLSFVLGSHKRRRVCGANKRRPCCEREESCRLHARAARSMKSALRERTAKSSRTGSEVNVQADRPDRKASHVSSNASEKHP